MSDRTRARSRPPLPKKVERIILAVTRAEKAAMKRAAAALGVTVPDYLVSLHRREAEAPARRAAWGRIGQLNRLAKDVEEGKAPPWTPEEKRQLNDYQAVKKALAEHVAAGGRNSMAERRRIASKVLAERKEDPTS